jgi:hypothetical protein
MDGWKVSGSRFFYNPTGDLTGWIAFAKANVDWTSSRLKLALDADKYPLFLMFQEFLGGLAFENNTNSRDYIGTLSLATLDRSKGYVAQFICLPLTQGFQLMSYTKQITFIEMITGD